MDDYFAEAEEHIVAVRRSLLVARSRLWIRAAASRARGVCSGASTRSRASRRWSSCARPNCSRITWRAASGRSGERRVTLTSANFETLVDGGQGARRRRRSPIATGSRAAAIAQRPSALGALARRGRDRRPRRLCRSRTARTPPVRRRALESDLRPIARPCGPRGQGGHGAQPAPPDRPGGERRPEGLSTAAACRSSSRSRRSDDSCARLHEDGVAYEPIHGGVDVAGGARVARRSDRATWASPTSHELRARRPGPAGRSDAAGRRHGGVAVAARGRAAARRARTCRFRNGAALQEHSGHRAAAARPARRRDARAPGAGRRDLPPHAVRRARSRARQRQARAARAGRPGDGDRQVPDRADDGSGAPSGPQRRQPRIETPEERSRGRQAAGGHDPPERLHRRRIGRARDQRRRPRHRRGGGGRPGARGGPARSPTATRRARGCSTSSARPASRPATRPTGRAAAASAWRSCAARCRTWAARWRSRPQPGRGTTFRITLPLTLAITDALIAHVGRRRRSPCRRRRSAK